MFPTPEAAAKECASYLNAQDEREDLIERLRESYDADNVAGWASCIKDWFVGTSHVYCAAFIGCAASEDEIMAEIDSLASTLHGLTSEEVE
jgi:hypothetical protein